MKRRWPLLLLLSCWLLILLVPSLWHLLRAQLFGDGFYRGWAYGPVPQLTDTFDAQKLNAQSTTDLRVLAVSAPHDLEALVEKNPREAWLLARLLQKSMAQMRTDRTGGELSDNDLAKHQAAKIPSPERLKTKANFTPAELKKWINLARRGQRLEPDNAYWDWLLVYFLMSGWRDEEAFRVLESGSRKPHFKAHQGEWVEAMRAAREAYFGNRLSPEAALSMQFFAMEDFSIYSRSRQREMARILVWQGIKAQRRGDHQKALRIFTALARLNYKAAQNAYSYLDRMVYRAIAALALSRAVERYVRVAPKFLSDKAMFEKRAGLLAKQVETYATTHGRADLGQEIGALALQEGRVADQLSAVFRTQLAFGGLNRRPIIWSISLYWISALLLLLLPMLAFWWLLLGITLRMAPVPAAEITSREIALPVTVAVGLMALLWGTGVACGASWRLLWLDIYDVAPIVIIGGIGALILGLLWPVPVAAWLIKRRARRREEKTQGEVPRGAREKWAAIGSRFRLASFLQISVLYGLVFTTLTWWFFTITAQDQTSWIELLMLDSTGFKFPFDVGIFVNWFPLWPQLAFALALAFLWLREVFAPDKSRVAYQLRLLRATFGALILVGSVAYLLLLVLMIPVRTRANVAVHQYMQRGEVASMLQNYGMISQPKK